METCFGKLKIKVNRKIWDSRINRPSRLIMITVRGLYCEEMQWYPCLSQLEILLEIGEEQKHRGESGGKEIPLNQSMQTPKCLSGQITYS